MQHMHTLRFPTVLAPNSRYCLRDDNTLAWQLKLTETAADLFHCNTAPLVHHSKTVTRILLICIIISQSLMSTEQCFDSSCWVSSLHQGLTHKDSTTASALHKGDILWGENARLPSNQDISSNYLHGNRSLAARAFTLHAPCAKADASKSHPSSSNCTSKLIVSSSRMHALASSGVQRGMLP